MKRFSVFLLFVFIVSMGFLSPQQSQAVPVDLELLLLVDVSGSVDVDEYLLQKMGYESAFDNPLVHEAISKLDIGLAVAYAEWSGAAQQALLVDWTFIDKDDAQDGSEDFADDIADTSRAFSGIPANAFLTAPGSAINWGVPLFDNDFEGNKEIDISGDGIQNDGDNTFDAATAAHDDNGVQINGLPIGSEGLAAWYDVNIVTPGGGFLISASSFEDFDKAILDKILKEVAGVPEPATLLLLGSGLIGLAGYGRKKFFKK